MFNETHELVNEFPEYKQVIQQLKQTDAHFTKLYNQYTAVTEKVSRMEKEFETVSDAVMEQAKKERLKLKDELFHLLKKAA